MMFTLDEEDGETEYGESFKASMKSSMKSQINYAEGRLKFMKRLQ